MQPPNPPSAEDIARILRRNGIGTLPAAFDFAAVADALTAAGDAINPAAFEASLAPISRYFVGMALPGGANNPPTFSSGELNGTAAVAATNAAMLANNAAPVQSIERTIIRLVSSDQIRKFAIGIRHIPPGKDVRRTLSIRMTSGVNAYLARGYTHMIAVFIGNGQAAAHAIESELHRLFGSHPKWDKDVHNTPGRNAADANAPTCVYVAIIRDDDEDPLAGDLE